MSEGEEVAKPGKIFELEEVKKHTREDDCWLVVDGSVYDVTEFLDEHPGGFDIIISNTGALIYSQPNLDCLMRSVVAIKFLIGSLSHDGILSCIPASQMSGRRERRNRGF